MSEQKARLRALVEDGDTIYAMRALDAYRSDHPDDPFAELMLGRLLIRRRDLVQARSALLRAEALDPEGWEAPLALAELALAGRRFDEARQTLERARESAGDVGAEAVEAFAHRLAHEAGWQKLSAARRAGSTERVLQACRDLVAATPGDPRALAEYGKALAATGEDASAIEVLLEAAQKNAPAEALELLGRLLFEHGAYARAAEPLAGAARLGLPRRLEDQTRERLLQAAEAYADAARGLRTWLDADEPSNGEAEVWLRAVSPVDIVDIDLAAARTQGACRVVGADGVYRVSAAEDGPGVTIVDPSGTPWVPAALVETARQAVFFARRQGYWERCITWCEIADLLGPRSRNALARADALLETGETTAAAALYRDLDPSNASAESCLRAVRAFSATGEPEAALAWLEGALDGGPDAIEELQTDDVFAELRALGGFAQALASGQDD